MQDDFFIVMRLIKKGIKTAPLDWRIKRGINHD